MMAQSNAFTILLFYICSPFLGEATHVSSVPPMNSALLSPSGNTNEQLAQFLASKKGGPLTPAEVQTCKDMLDANIGQGIFHCNMVSFNCDRIYFTTIFD